MKWDVKENGERKGSEENRGSTDIGTRKRIKKKLLVKKEFKRR